MIINVVNYLIIIILLLLLLGYTNIKSINNKFHLENKIKYLQENYNNMIKSNRITVDLCAENDKLGIARSKIFSVGNNCEPWIARECIYVLEHIITQNSVGLEWSSGSSTIWLGYRLKYLISIENNYNWAKNVKNVVKRLKLNNKIFVYYIANDNIKSCKNESKYISSNKFCYFTYVTNDIISNRVYDYISIDGRARTGCILRAIKLIKEENGILIIDNSDRYNYQWAINKIPNCWSRFDYPYINGVVSLWITHKL